MLFYINKYLKCVIGSFYVIICNPNLPDNDTENSIIILIYILKIHIIKSYIIRVLFTKNTKNMGSTFKMVS